MKRKFLLPGAALVAGLAAPPALAAEDFRDGATDRYRAAFAGVQFRVNLSGKRLAPPTARLTMGVTHYGRNGQALQRGNYTSSVELGFSGRGGANLYVGGQRLSDIQQRLGIAPAAAALIAVTAVGVGAVVISEMDRPEVACMAIGCPIPKD